MKKEKYEKPIYEVLSFEMEDVITASPGTNDDKIPWSF